MLSRDINIIRVQKDKENPYVMINKEFLRNTKLSLKAKGLLAYILSLPDDWKIYIKELANHHKDGKDSISATLKELILNHYIIRETIREKGQFKGYSYKVFETPRETSITPKPEKPFSGNPEPEKPKSGNPQLLINDLTNNDSTNNNSTTTTNLVVVANNLKDEIENKIGFISWKGMNFLLAKSNEQTIKYYLDNWNKFKTVNMKTKVGFFINAIIENYPFPEVQKGKELVSNKPIQSTNYEQREYDDEYFNSLYDNAFK